MGNCRVEVIAAVEELVLCSEVQSVLYPMFRFILQILYDEGNLIYVVCGIPSFELSAPCILALLLLPYILRQAQ